METILEEKWFSPYLSPTTLYWVSQSIIWRPCCTKTRSVLPVKLGQYTKKKLVTFVHALMYLYKNYWYFFDPSHKQVHPFDGFEQENAFLKSFYWLWLQTSYVLACTHAQSSQHNNNNKEAQVLFLSPEFFAHMRKVSTCQNKGLRERERREVAIMAVFGDKGEGEKAIRTTAKKTGVLYYPCSSSKTVTK